MGTESSTFSDGFFDKLRCARCGRRPEDIEEYVDAARTEGVEGYDPREYVWDNEGTLNKHTGGFLCTLCYIICGMPTSPEGWKVPDGWEWPNFPYQFAD